MAKNRIPQIPILMYHSVAEVSERGKKSRSTNPAYSLSVKQFREQMEYLHTNGYKTLRLDQLLFTTSLISHEKVIPAKAGIQKDTGFRIKCGMTDSLRSMSLYIDDKTVPQKSLVITFDDGWADNFTNAFPILKNYGLTATIFIISGFVGKENYVDWHQLREMSEAGFSIQSHTVSHKPLVGLTDDQLMHELSVSKKSIEDHVGKSVDFLSLPHGVFNGKVLEIAQKARYQAICTSEPGFSHAFKNLPVMKRINISDQYKINVFEKIMQRDETVILPMLASKKIKNIAKRLLGYSNYRKLYQLKYQIRD